MKTILHVVELVVGIAILYGGAAWLIRGSAGLARVFGVKPLVIGLTVVAYGTSAPEVAVATKTALANSQPIALGTVIGSCAANISLILGITALIAPPTIDSRIIRREVPILLGSAIAVPLLLRDGILSRTEGLLLIASAVIFTIVTLTVSAKLDPDDDVDWHPGAEAEQSGADIGGRARPRQRRAASILLSILGLGLLVLGSDLFVRGGRQLAAEINMSERMLGLTVIAIGTSLPELIGSIVAASRGHAALAVGSVIGANLLNVFLVLGITAYLAPINLTQRMHAVDLIGLVVITLLGILTLRGSRKISRVEGALLILAYVGFLVACAIF